MNNPKRIIVILIAIIAVLAAFYFAMPKAPADNQAPEVVTEATTTASLVTLTQSDNNRRVTIHKGDKFVLALGEMDWTISISNQDVISRVKNFAMIRGAQGVYTADNVGTSVISAEGRPICAQGEMCAQYIVNWSATINVL